MTLLSFTVWKQINWARPHRKGKASHKRAETRGLGIIGANLDVVHTSDVIATGSGKQF